MIETLPESSGNILGFRFSGMISEEDITDVLIPGLEEASEKYGIIRLVVEIIDYKGEDLGAQLEDFLDKDRKILYIEREAVVGEEGWDKMGTGFHDFFFVFPNTETRFFSHDRRMQAWAWIREGVTVKKI
ncbi:MAG TPA: STAS/SEC14 domain-containing protein [Methanoregulaceae archaeon]|nr:STAS/SEC14 domain-containing protein [Methanoregulaceae archaeon]